MGKQFSVSGLNHVTLAVSDVERAIKFYTGGLGLTLRKESKSAVHLEAGSFWICLSPDPATRKEPHPDYTHIAFDVPQEDFPHCGDEGLMPPGHRSCVTCLRSVPLWNSRADPC